MACPLECVACPQVKASDARRDVKVPADAVEIVQGVGLALVRSVVVGRGTMLAPEHKGGSLILLKKKRKHATYYGV